MNTKALGFQSPGFRAHHTMNIERHHTAPLTNLLLALADDKLMLGHRNSDWTGLGPILEEDIAFSALAQDEIAHAQAIYQFISEFAGRDENELAFGRTPEAYLCARIVEPPDEFDWAVAIVRQFLCDHFDLLRLRRLAKSAHKPLADLAARIADEEQVHVEHADSWMRRLGAGTPESRERVQKALDQLAPLAGSLFEPVEAQDVLERDGLYPPEPDDPFTTWRSAVSAVLDEADLKAEFARPSVDLKGGRRGVHTPVFSELLDEMCEVYRIEPGAAW